MNCLEITTSIGCMNRCPYCPQDKLLSSYPQDGNRVLELANFKELLHKIPKTVKIHFSGFSEPFQNVKCIDMIEHAISNGYEVGMYTTTIGMNDSIIRRLIGLKIDPFYVHAVGRNTDEWVTNVNSMESKGIDFKYIQVGSYANCDSIAGIFAKTDKVIEYQEEVSRAGNLDYMETTHVTGPIACKDNREYQNVLTPNGDIYLCCMDYSLTHKLGNLYHCSYDRMHTGDMFKKVIKQMNEEDNDLLCRECFRAISI